MPIRFNFTKDTRSKCTRREQRMREQSENLSTSQPMHCIHSHRAFVCVYRFLIYYCFVLICTWCLCSDCVRMEDFDSSFYSILFYNYSTGVFTPSSNTKRKRSSHFSIHTYEIQSWKLSIMQTIIFGKDSNYKGRWQPKHFGVWILCYVSYSLNKLAHSSRANLYVKHNLILDL